MRPQNHPPSGMRIRLRHLPSPLLRVEEPERVVADDAFVVLPIGEAPEGGGGRFQRHRLCPGEGGPGSSDKPWPPTRVTPRVS